MLRNVVLVLLVLIGAATQTRAADLSCRQLAASAARDAGIPEDILSAIAVVESGRGDEGWPWTLNVAGKGFHFDTREEALQHLETVLGQGETRVDIGCMQLNVKWHGKAFTSANDMLDPVRNTTYAAYFLSELYKRTGSWDAAIANYHHSDPKLGNAYLAKVAQVRGVPAREYAGLDAPQSDDVRSSSAEQARQIGILIAGQQALVSVGPDDAYAVYGNLPELAEVNLTQAQVQKGLKSKEALPPRLARRWEAVERAREILASR